jgi:AAA lid domain
MLLRAGEAAVPLNHLMTPCSKATICPYRDHCAGRPDRSAQGVQRGRYRRGAHAARARADRAQAGEDAHTRDCIPPADRACPQAHGTNVGTILPIHRIAQGAAAVSNARSIRNALDRMRLRQANRLVSDLDRLLSTDDIKTIEDADVLASRVFSMPERGPDKSKLGGT